jgi:hypothetical protein
MPTARSIQVTLGAGATQIATTPTYCNQMDVQNNAAAVCRLGDSTVSSTKGVQLLAAGVSGSKHTIGPFAGMQVDASQYQLYGTSSQLIDVLLT